MPEKQRGPRKTVAGGGDARAMPARRRPEDAPDRRITQHTSPKRSTGTFRRLENARRAAHGNAPRPPTSAASERRKRSPQMAAAVARGARKPMTKRAMRGAGPRSISGSTRGGKR